MRPIVAAQYCSAGSHAAAVSSVLFLPCRSPSTPLISRFNALCYKAVIDSGDEPCACMPAEQQEVVPRHENRLTRTPNTVCDCNTEGLYTACSSFDDRTFLRWVGRSLMAAPWLPRHTATTWRLARQRRPTRCGRQQLGSLPADAMTIPTVCRSRSRYLVGRAELPCACPCADLGV